MITSFVLGVSTLLQFAAAFFALRLIRITGKRMAWGCIAAAVFLMAVRRSITFFRLMSGDLSRPPDLSAELVALVISILMVAGITWIAPLFLAIRRSEDKLRENGELTRVHVERLAVLQALSRRISSTLDIEGVLTSVVQATLKLLEADQVRLRLLSPDGETLLLKAGAGGPPDSRGGPERIPVKGSLGGAVVQGGKPIIVGDVRQEVRWLDPDWAREYGIRAYIGVPLILCGEVAGVLSSFSMTSDRFQKSDIELVESLSAQAAVALENARAFEAVRIRSGQQEALRKVTQDIMENMDLPTLFSRICQSVCKLLGVEIARVYILDEKSEAFSLTGSFSQSKGEKFISTFPKGKGLLHRIASRKQPVVVPDVLKDPDWGDPEWAREAGLKSYLGIPLLKRGRVVGALSCFTKQVREFCPDEIELLTDFADQALVALENARAFEQVNKKSAQSAKLNEINLRLSSTLDVDVILENILNAARELVGGAHMGMFLLEDKGRTLVPHPQSFVGWDPIGPQPFTIRVGENLSGWVAKHRQVLAISEARRDPRWVEMPWSRGRSRGGYAGLPLLAGDDLIGVLFCFTEEVHDWTRDELELLNSFAAQAAVAMRNARLHEALVSSEERYRALTETAFDSVISLDAEGRITLLNPTAQETFGYPADEALGTPVTRLLHEDSREECKTTIENLLESRESDIAGRTVVMRGLRKDGSVFPLEASISAADVGGHIQITGICRDITDRLRAEERLRASQARFQGILEDASDAIFSVDEGQRIIVFNKQAESVFGYRAEEVMGQPIDLLLPPRFRKIHRGNVKGFAAEEVSRRLMGDRDAELIGLRKNGEEFPVEITISKLEAEGKLVLTAIVRDITERKRVEAERARHAAQFQGLADVSLTIHSAPSTDAVLQVITDRAREVIGAHQSVTSVTVDENWAQAITAISLSEKYAEWREYDEKPDGSGIYRLVCQSNRPIRMTQAELEANPAWRGFGDAAGKHPPMRGWLAAPLRERNGRNLGLIQLSDKCEGEFTEEDEAILVQLAEMASVAVENIRLLDEVRRDTEELERRVAERTSELRESNTEMESFSYSVSHDLRAPLRAMQGLTQALLEDYGDKLDPVGQDYARRVVDAAGKMDALIQDLLSYSRLGRADLQFHPVSLASVVEDVLAQLDAGLREQEAEVTAEGPLPQVVGHYATLIQVMTNLLTNAVKFVAPGTRPRVRIWAEERGEWARLWVEDNGIGIAPEHQERIFGVFERLHGGETYPGTGIGLAVVHKAAARMGGRVGVESAPGQGSRFWVELARVEDKP